MRTKYFRRQSVNNMYSLPKFVTIPAAVRQDGSGYYRLYANSQIQVFDHPWKAELNLV